MFLRSPVRLGVIKQAFTFGSGRDMRGVGYVKKNTQGSVDGSVSQANDGQYAHYSVL